MREIDGSFDFCDRYYQITLKKKHRSINCAEASPCLIENVRMLVSKKWSNVDQFSSVQSLDRLGRRGDTRNDSAEIPFKSCLQEALVSILAWTGMSTL